MTAAPVPVHTPAVNVTIRLKGAMGPAVRAAFEDLDVTIETIITGVLADDAAVQGVLRRLGQFGLSLSELQVTNETDRH
jgi:hypothetical protein